MAADAAIAVAVFLGGFVIFEPAPYEVMLAALLCIWIIAGMRIARTLVPLLVLLVLYNAGGVIASFQMEMWTRGILYVAVSLFLALSTIFFAAVIAEDMGRLRLIFRAYVVGATLSALLGIIGYFGALPGFDVFTRYSRAMGAFQDPNVFGPFLVPPILYLMYGIMARSATMLPVRAVPCAILLLGLFLSFSRAAWGLCVMSMAIFYFLLLVNEHRAKMRLKYITLGVAGAAFVIVMLTVALQSDAVASLFAERAKAVQDYDGGRGGRFARHALGFMLALERPLGIGALEFGYIFGEDTHNNLVKALMAYGWLGFVSWVTVMAWTLIAGFKLLFRPRPWQVYYQIAYTVFAGHQVIGYVIDTDHWRHFYLMLAIVWGCMTLERRWRSREPASVAPGEPTRAAPG